MHKKFRLADLVIAFSVIIASAQSAIAQGVLTETQISLSLAEEAATAAIA